MLAAHASSCSTDTTLPARSAKNSVEPPLPYSNTLQSGRICAESHATAVNVIQGCRRSSGLWLQ